MTDTQICACPERGEGKHVYPCWLFEPSPAPADEILHGNKTTYTTEQRYDAVTALFQSLSVPDTRTNREQAGILLEAFLIFVERNSEYNELWRVAGYRGILCDMRKKLDRLWAVYFNHKTNRVNPDSVIDLVNYTVFFGRLLSEGNRDGWWPWPMLESRS